MMANELHVGIIGAGGFARFAAHAFLNASGIKVIAVTDIDQDAARQMAAAMGLVVYDNFEQLLNANDVHLIYIATPPCLHYAQSKMALLAGKHVICEKPAALKTNEAEELVALASERQLLYVVNLMQRYNPLFEMVQAIIQQKILGNFLHGFFENYASDENLGPDHWFWDASKSGGIFIEHGVHFFDLFEGWLGAGKVIGSWKLNRSNISKEITDRVQATVLYQGGIVNFYHGFDQPKILDRQEMRLQFERGDVTLYEWVPVKIKLHGLLGKGQLKQLREIMGATAIIHHHVSQDAEKNARGRFADIVFEDHTTVEYKYPSGKTNLYREMLTWMISDQCKWIKAHDHNVLLTIAMQWHPCVWPNRQTKWQKF